MPTNREDYDRIAAAFQKAIAMSAGVNDEPRRPQSRSEAQVAGVKRALRLVANALEEGDARFDWQRFVNRASR